MFGRTTPVSPRRLLALLWLCIGLGLIGLARPADAQTNTAWYVYQSVPNLNGTTNVLWIKAGTTDTSGNYSGDLVSIWTVDATGHETAIGPTYGPYPGWRANQLSPTFDGTLTLLWDNQTTSGDQVSLWHLDSTGHMLSIGPAYGPFPGWSADFVQTQADGTSALYWGNYSASNGGEQLSIWTVSASGTRLATSPTYGPYAGWIVNDAAPSLNQDGSVFLSWVNDGTDDGSGNYSGDQVSIWKTDARGNRLSTSPTYGPYPGWRFIRLFPAYDGTARLVWIKYGTTDIHGTYSGDQISLWDVDSQGGDISISPTYGPYASWGISGFAVAPDNTLRLQWTHQLASAYDGTYTSSTTYADGYTHTETDTVSNGSVTGHHTFTNGGPVGTFDWTGTLTPPTIPYDDAHITGSGTINNGGTRSFTLNTGGIGVDSDGTVRVHWTGTDPVFGSIGGIAVRQTPAPESVSLWKLDASGHETAISPTYGPYSGWSADYGLMTVLPDGTERLLWEYGVNYSNNDQASEFSLWSLDSSNQYTAIGQAYGPYP